MGHKTAQNVTSSSQRADSCVLCIFQHMCLYSTESGVISVCGWTGSVVLYVNVLYMCLSHVKPLWYLDMKAAVWIFTLNIFHLSNTK